MPGKEYTPVSLYGLDEFGFFFGPPPKKIAKLPREAGEGAELV